MRILLSLLLFCMLQTARASDYYFSSVSGDDSRTSTEAQNPSTPWKTLRKLNSFFSNLLPGDAVLLKRGETFYGSIIVNKSGTLSDPIRIDAYGSGDKPVITSLVTLTDWVSKGNGIWESDNSALGEKLNMVLFNGAEKELGRYPNIDAANKGFLTLDSYYNVNSITDNELPNSPNFTGAELVIRSRRWILDRDLIKSVNNHVISYKSASGYWPLEVGYFIQNSIKTLDKLGEWYYSTAGKKLSVYFGSGKPSSYTVEATTIDNLVFSNKFSNLIFSNISFSGANGNNFYIRSGSNIKIQNCEVLFSGVNGVEVANHTNFTIESSTISNSNNSAIDLGYSGNYATIRNNTILNTALIPGMGQSGDGQGIAIFSNGNGNVIENNKILNTGYNAINFNGSNVTIKNNFIDGFCLTKDDGAGIYSHIGALVLPKGRKVNGNIILNGKGVPEGAKNPALLSAEGIYMDKNASDVEIKDNTIANCGNNGVYFHNTHEITFRNNTIFNCTKQLTLKQESTSTAHLIRNNIIADNILFSKLPSQLSTFIKSGRNDVDLFGKFSNNYYARPLDDRLVISNNYVKNGNESVVQKLDLRGWQEKYNIDAGSKKSARQIAPYKLNKLKGDSKVENGTFDNNVSGVFKSASTVTWSNSGQLDGGYLQVEPSARSSSVYLRIGVLKAGKKYILKYSVKGSVDSSTSISAYLRQDGSPYGRITPVETRKINITRSNNEILFSSVTTEASAAVVFNVDDVSKYYLDNIQFYEAEATVTNPDDSIKFVYNASDVKKTVSLDGNYIDVKGKKFKNSITLSPFTSAVLLIDNNVDDEENIDPEVAITSPEDNQNFATSATIKIAADATDDDGTISKVEFYNGKKLLATNNVAPYTYNWNNVPDGTYSITAKATDNEGAETISPVVNITVGKPQGAPYISITSPTAKANYSGSAVIKITAKAGDDNGTVKRVEFYNGSKLLTTEYYSPYTYNWVNVANGSYTITAKAIDDDGLETVSDAVNITVGQVSGAPVVSITSPSLGDPFTSPATIELVAEASDTNGSISKVDFYYGSILLHTEFKSPYTFTWKNVKAGNYKIEAVATDNEGNVATSDPVSILVKGANGANAENRAVLAKASSDAADFSKPALNLKLSPNPARNILNIVTSGFNQNEKLSVTVLSASGSAVKTIQSAVTANQTIQVDVSLLQKGTYIVRAASGNKILSAKFVKL